ncbi:MAG: PQQ-binding-like beta-propeller repeat protein [Planctomycetaceae bacterium]
MSPASGALTGFGTIQADPRGKLATVSNAVTVNPLYFQRHRSNSKSFSKSFLYSGDESFVRRHALWALVRLFGEPGVLDDVQARLKDQNRGVREAAASVLGANGPKAEVAIPVLLDAARDNEPFVARAAIAALGRIGGDSEIVICALTAIAHEGSSRQRNSAIAALGKIGPAAKAAVPVVVGALSNDDLDVRIVARQTLRHIDFQLSATLVGPPFDAVAASQLDRAALKVGPDDWPQWGGSRQRNNTPSGRNIPTEWDITSGKNIKWAVKLGSETYGNPCIANGKVFIGTNNGNGYLQRYPATVDLGVMLCFDEATGRFLWQYSSPKLPVGRVHDWPNQGMPSTPDADGRRLWATTNRGEIVCLDADGFRDNENDGPFRDETNQNHDEADIIWRFDMIKNLGVSPHNMSNCSILMADGMLFVCTSNGVDEGHSNIPAPDAPSFFAMNCDTGNVLWTNNSPGRNILHAQWASASYGVFGGQPQVLFPGGDGWLYSFDPNGDGLGNSKVLWKFDCNPKKSLYTLTRATRNSLIGFACIYDGLIYVAVGDDPEHGDGQGHLWCIDPTKHGDVSPMVVYNSENPDKPIAPKRLQALDEKAGDFERENPNSAAVWHYTGEDPKVFETTMHRTMGTVAIKNDILFVLDFGGLFHCVNAKTGKAYWTYDLFAESWGSPLIVEDHVYICDTDGDVAIFRHSAEPETAFPMGAPFAEICMETAIFSTPVVANNVLYIATRNTLYAIETAPE